MEPALVPASDGPWRPSDLDKRRAHWHSFNVILALAYLGIVLDVVTTRIGFGMLGSQYEQNPVGAFVIAHFGWWGLLLVLTVVCLICQAACRPVFFRMSPRWSVMLNGVLALLTVVRWIVVLTAVVYIVQ